MTMALNGIDLLVDQHRRVRGLIDNIAAARPENRQADFDRLCELLSAHETAEELILRPVTRHLVRGGNIIADIRADEESDSKDALHELEQLGVESPDFSELFERFAQRVLDHADNEEVYEFPLVRAHLDAPALSAMTDAIQRAEAVSPTHPHPHIRSMTASVVLGPVASMVDRVRDVLAAGRT